MILSIGQQNEHILKKHFQEISSLLPRFGTVQLSLSKIMDFKENDLFQENEQNEQISVKFRFLKREPSTVCCTCLKYYQNSNEQISMKSKK